MGPRAKRSVLVVEDEAAVRRMLRAALEAKGLEVLEAGNGREALEQLSRHHVDLLLTDWNMPEMCGRELLAKLRGSADRSMLPVIVVSGAATPDSPGVKPEYFDGWLKKPFRIGDVQTLVLGTIGCAPGVA